MSHILNLEGVGFGYDKTTQILSDFSFKVDQGEIVCLLGPSGCGKTTALRIIAGFEPIQEGTVTINGKQVADAASCDPPEARKIGMVFQDAALFPHLTIANNIGFGLHKESKQARQERIKELVSLIDSEGYEQRYPHELSGGQRQRVALARAMAPRPALILFDEPFSNLDADLREKLGRELRHVLKKSEATVVLVTHDQNEAFVMADRITLMNQGQIIQTGTPQDLYNTPANPFAANFIGEGHLIKGTIQKDGRAMCALGDIAVEGEGLEPGMKVEILVRPEQVIVSTAGVAAKVEDVFYRGSDTLTQLTLEDGTKLSTRSPIHDRELHVAVAKTDIRLCAWKKGITSIRSDNKLGE